ncbi:GntR family transcriptional regulator [Variovorax terrae]|uniref:GntR family transcriptional regulator n=1 Tax=Variovorax terrae TaxID=2923278 RepID=A0A9X1VV76_9BURK|nr:GntR family transcriptional regulator [Variovorax terrae]MCJ0764441.1 GntR family transcriptional regulator [Variovorax terrae]
MPASSLPVATTSPVKLGEQHRPLSAIISDTLRERILSGEFPTGHRLVEGHLSEEMGVSRIPIREALRLLAAEGLLTIEPRRGASVALLSDQMAHDMVEVRATLEGLNAKLAAQRRDDKTVARLQDVLDQGKTAVNDGHTERFVELNAQFHELLATIANNGVLTELMRSLRERTGLLFAPSNMQRARQNWEEHAQILQAVIAGNGELASLLAMQHVHNAAQAYAASRPPAP